MDAVYKNNVRCALQEERDVLEERHGWGQEERKAS